MPIDQAAVRDRAALQDQAMHQHQRVDQQVPRRIQVQAAQFLAHDHPVRNQAQDQVVLHQVQGQAVRHQVQDPAARRQVLDRALLVREAHPLLPVQVRDSRVHHLVHLQEVVVLRVDLLEVAVQEEVPVAVRAEVQEVADHKRK